MTSAVMTAKMPGSLLAPFIVALLPMGVALYLVSWGVRQEASAVGLLAVALPLVMLAFTWLYWACRWTFWILLPYVVFFCLTIASALLIEYGAYLPELDLSGEPNGTAARLAIEVALLVLIVGLASGPAVNREAMQAARLANDRAPVNARDIVLVGLAASVLAAPAVNLLVHGAPILQGLDRVAFYQLAGSEHLRLMMLFMAAVPSLGILAMTASSRVVSIAATSLVVTSLTILVLSGEKFHGLVMVLYAAMLPALLLGRRKVVRRMVVALLALLALVVGLVQYHYSEIYQQVDVGEFALGRMAAQAEVPWAIDQQVIGGLPPDVRGWVADSLHDEQAAQGMERLMLAIAPHSFVVPFIELGSRFTMGFPAVLKSHVGSWGVVLMVPYAVLVGLFVRLLIEAARRRMLFTLWLGMNLVGYGALFDQILLLGNIYQVLYSEWTRFVWTALLATAFVIEYRLIRRVRS